MVDILQLWITSSVSFEHVRINSLIHIVIRDITRTKKCLWVHSTDCKNYGMFISWVTELVLIIPRLVLIIPRLVWNNYIHFTLINVSALNNWIKEIKNNTLHFDAWFFELYVRWNKSGVVKGVVVLHRNVTMMQDADQNHLNQSSKLN